MLTREQYAEFGKPYDLEVLQRCRAGWLNVLHAHGDSNLLIEDYLHYPVDVLNWSDRITGLSLQAIRSQRPDLCLMGGIHERGPISKGTAAEMEARSAMPSSKPTAERASFLRTAARYRTTPMKRSSRPGVTWPGGLDAGDR